MRNVKFLTIAVLGLFLTHPSYSSGSDQQDDFSTRGVWPSVWKSAVKFRAFWEYTEPKVDKALEIAGKVTGNSKIALADQVLDNVDKIYDEAVKDVNFTAPTLKQGVANVRWLSLFGINNSVPSKSSNLTSSNQGWGGWIFSYFRKG